ncbi:hypothetical protein [Variovorax sp. R-27]|uniref:hypothetical protein n=1 Tax=Variovorax sp. R-27 TaxID=3404058 RepID=UPI003CFB449C
MGKNYTRIGIVISVVYSLGLTYVLHRRWDELFGLKLNEFGDLLAGAFGPLAILWLVLGYFQQGIELRLNSDALHLQAEELAHSVEQQRELVKVARDQYHSDREAIEHQMKVFADEQERIRSAAMPKFKVTAGGMHSGFESTHRLHFSNFGQTCSDVNLTSDRSDLQFRPESILLLKTGESVRFEFALPVIPPFEESRVTLSFIDGQGQAGAIEYKMTFQKEEGVNYSTVRLDPVDAHKAE